MRRVAKKDANHVEAVEWLRRHGVEVHDFGNVGLCPDLLAIKGGTVAWIEMKIEGSKARWYARQLKWIANTKFNVIVAKSGEQALRDIRDKKFISQRSKDSIAALLSLEPREYYTPKVVEQLLGA